MIQKKEKNYNYCLDFIKGIACFWVVCMHCEFPGKLGIVVQCISRFCVPFFFMVSGYYSFYEEDSPKKSIGEKLKHILNITLGATAINIIFAFSQYILELETYSVSIKDVFVWILFNQAFILSSPMWFLFALLYVYILYWGVEKLHLQKVAYYAIPILMVIYIFLAQGLHFMGVYVPNYLYRNFLIEGFPFFMLGHFLHSRYDRIRISNTVLIVVLAIFTALNLVERYICGRDFGVNICSIPQVIALFQLGIQNATWGKGIIQIIGKKYSMMIYILHPIVWKILELLYDSLYLYERQIALYLMPFATFFISLAIAAMYQWIKKVHFDRRNV
ncbi:MAG: acyltransferase family protein [Lachnospiraceae bacterium]